MSWRVYMALIACLAPGLLGIANAMMNVAVGALCCASSEYDSRYTCEKAVDDNTKTAWASLGGGVGVWIHLDFGGAYSIQELQLMDRWRELEKNKDVLLTFSDESTQLVTMTRHGNGRFWDTFTLNPVVTYWVKIQVKTVYTKLNNGFIEIKFFGMPVPRGPLNDITSCVTTDIGARTQTSVSGKVSGSLQPNSKLSWEKFFSNRKCFTECARNVQCSAVVFNVQSEECRVIRLSCVLTNLPLNNDVVIWTPER